ncbi:Pkinase-domain-containing protein [Metschnikowia bicuspidata var. bicuspidata NRRL YB-4993]|uniref:Pkinase-domain-containing protein n=1 Tax=Metschnikowia bicuspidata var. bicuspidata NRRL YB-4993 TaxID=869754 RepID=A0A1A0HHM6_9ASCO|nr:Pkinase-domain-containing protein [Metschnikowia bicuspidata var. bicuspidata NRRL YB-4993]OBA23382.1 Pkinase-domain-containing protein [Metschnikowia bicuspidata var. bicuspidata NRRL YB-4993]
MCQDIWPKFKTQQVSRSPEKQNLPCPYILSRKVLGTGSYANVYECKNAATGAHYAAKRFSKRLIYGNELMLQREFQVLKTILRGHPNILLMIDYFETSDFFYLVTELAVGGELFQRITEAPEGKLNIVETSHITSVILLAINHLHSNGIVHRDIKAENILFASNTSKASLLLLADFGQARILKLGEKAQSFDGTLSYLAPEVLSKCGHSFPVDLWAVGVLTYFMLCGYMPFDCDTDAETKHLISNADYIFEPDDYWSAIPDTAKDFISKCLKLDPSERITAQAALEHAFVRNAGSNIKPAFSSNSLQQLQEKVLRLHNSRNASSLNWLHGQMTSSRSQKEEFSFSNLSTNPNSSYGSNLTSSSCLLDGRIYALEGGKCHSPETVTSFTTPVTSALASREGSRMGLDSFMMGLALQGNAPIDDTKTGKAEFTL